MTTALAAADQAIQAHTTITREVVIRAATGSRTFTGIGVPYNEIIELGWAGREQFAPGSVTLADPALILWQHRNDEPIGLVSAGHDTDAGYELTGSLVAGVPRADEALILMRAGIITKLSIGFEPLEYSYDVDEDLITWTAVRAREFSLVSFPAYETAAISDIRHQPQQEEPMPDTITRAELDAALDDHHRGIALDLANLRDLAAAPSTPTDTRTAGEILKAIVAGDQETIAAYDAMTRAYTGGTTTDLGTTLKPGWVGDLTKIFDASSGVLADVFSTGPLPAAGMSIEYAELATNTIAVAQQAAEGDDIGFGKVTLTTKSAPVKTYAGGTSLARQEIERATVGVLNTSLDALSTAAGARKKAELRTAFNALVAARVAVAADAGVVVLGATLAAATSSQWENVLVDAAIKFEALAMPLEVLIVSASVFKQLRSLTVTGDRVFETYKDNASGELNLIGLSGQLAGLPVRLDSGQAGNSAVFANARALRQYDSALVSLSDENIVNLSKSFAVYRYGAIAAEIPAAVVPVKITP